MNAIIRLVLVVASLVLMLNTTPSWGQPTCASPGCNPTTSDANSNTAGGTGTLSSVTGFSNTAFGKNALNGNTTGFFNTAVGESALKLNHTGTNNTAVGGLALFSNDTGSSNTASGAAALENNTTGNFNTATGTDALVVNTTGSGNSAIGALALNANTTGSNNTAVGLEALRNSTGTKNIAIGFRAGTNLTAGNNNIYLSNPGVSSEFQTMRLGSTQTQTFIAGIANAAVPNAATVIIDTTTGQLGVPLSSARYKQDIAPMGTRSEKVLQLRPVTFAYRDDAKAMTHYGLIAEEVAAVLPELVTRTPAGDVQTVKYQELIPMLLNELQRQREDLKRQQQELTELRALVAGQLAGQRTITAGPLLTQSESDEAVR